MRIEVDINKTVLFHSSNVPALAAFHLLTFSQETASNSWLCTKHIHLPRVVSWFYYYVYDKLCFIFTSFLPSCYMLIYYLHHSYHRVLVCSICHNTCCKHITNIILPACITHEVVL